MSFTVVSPGARSLFQDHGRTGYEHLGVPTSGAADRSAHDLANALVGNPPDRATIEVTLGGLDLLCERESVIAVAGGDVDIFVDASPVPPRHSLLVRGGQRVRIASLRSGVFTYLAVAGGFTPAPVLGSAASCTLSGLGPAPLSAGDWLSTGSPDAPAFRALAADYSHNPVHSQSRSQSRSQFRSQLGTLSGASALRYVPGPHAHLFTRSAHEVFTSAHWVVSADSSRVGVRLDGPGGAALDMPAVELGSLGMVDGAIQVPPNGAPVVLGPDHGTTGGYPVIGSLVPGDLSALMQARPGTTVTFREVTAQEAAQAWVEGLSTRAGLIDLDLIAG